MRKYLQIRSTPLLKEVSGEILRLVRHFERRAPLFKKQAESAARGASVNLLLMSARQSEAVATLANSNLTLFPAAAICARTAFEGWVIAHWLLYPDDAYEQEARYLTYVSEEEWERKRSVKRGWDIDGFDLVESIDLELFREQSASKLPSTVEVGSRLPRIEDMLKEIGLENYYQQYARLSAYAHNSHSITGFFRMQQSMASDPLQVAKYCLTEFSFSMILAYKVMSTTVQMTANYLDGDNQDNADVTGINLEWVDKIRVMNDPDNIPLE
jgi:hypothetical protein